LEIERKGKEEGKSQETPGTRGVEPKGDSQITRCKVTDKGAKNKKREKTAWTGNLWWVGKKPGPTPFQSPGVERTTNKITGSQGNHEHLNSNSLL